MHGGFDAYKGKFEALLSAHYIAAVVVHDRTLTLAQFEPNRYDDAKLRQFAAGKVEVRADAALRDAQAAVEMETFDGAILSARCQHPLGSCENPLSRAQVEQKFRTYARGQLPDPLVAEVIGAVAELESLASVRALMDTLRVPPRAARPAVAAAE
jgi:2-methylcitrate dehydratase PrpD